MGTRLATFGTASLIGLLLGTLPLVLAGCDKERIVTSTEYVHDVEYVQLPPDTIVVRDTVFDGDSVTVVRVDTVRTTIYVHDTVVTVQHHYDTVRIIDTVLQSSPNGLLAISALQYHTDPLVFDLINQEFGLTDGWVLYSSPFQMDVVQQSAGVYDVAGYIDYWTVDWSGYYPIDFYWRVSYKSGDPANPNNWQLSDPPAAVSGKFTGLNRASRIAVTAPLLK